MYNFFRQAYSTYKGLFYWLNWSGYISGVVLQPMAFLLMFSVLGRFAVDPGASQDYALGITVYSMTFALFNGMSQCYSNDRNLGTISFLFISPASRLVNYLSRSIFHYPTTLLSFVCGLLAAWAIVGLDFAAVNWAGFIVTLFIIITTVIGFGHVLGVFSIMLRNWMVIQSFSIGLLLLITGAIIPLRVFPDIVAEFAKLLPMTNGLMAIRDTFAGAALSDVSGNVLREAVTGLAYFAIGFVGFMQFERISKRRGTLELGEF
jgi:ABC-2 type transport system permease protein